MANALFIDTSAFIALAISNDRYHNDAVQYWESLSPKPPRFTTGLVVSETYTLLRRWTGYGGAYRLLESIRKAEDSGMLTTMWPGSDWPQEIHHTLTSFPDQDISYADAVSLVACRRRPTIRSIFTFDHHLGLTGLTIVPGSVRKKGRPARRRPR